MYVKLEDHVLDYVVCALYLQFDAALICWMFVFTKNLYDDIVKVFAQKPSFTVVTAIIWGVSILIGLICPFLLILDKKYESEQNSTMIFEAYYQIYSTVKLVILIVNLVMFWSIFKVVIQKNDKTFRSVLKTCVVSFILVTISSVQVFLQVAFSEILSHYLETYPEWFALIHSYQIIPITSIFVMITQNGCRNESLTEQIMKKIVRETV